MNNREIKLAEVGTTFKKDDLTKSKNHWNVSVLPTVLKVFERLMQDKCLFLFKKILSPYMCRHRKGFSTQQALLPLIETWKGVLDRKGFGCGVLMDLSKALNKINYDLLLVQLHAHGFTNKSLRLTKIYFENRWQRTEVNSSFSKLFELLLGVPQRSLLGPLFNIYLNDLFYLTECNNVCNYADATTFHACDLDLKDLITILEHDSLLAIEWFQANCIKLNEEKCHLFISGHKHEFL